MSLIKEQAARAKKFKKLTMNISEGNLLLLRSGCCFQLVVSGTSSIVNECQTKKVLWKVKLYYKVL